MEWGRAGQSPLHVAAWAKGCNGPVMGYYWVEIPDNGTVSGLHSNGHRSGLLGKHLGKSDSIWLMSSGNKKPHCIFCFLSHPQSPTSQLADASKWHCSTCRHTSVIESAIINWEQGLYWRYWEWVRLKIVFSRCEWSGLIMCQTTKNSETWKLLLLSVALSDKRWAR